MIPWQLVGNAEVSVYYGYGEPFSEEQANFIVDALNKADIFDKGKLITFSLVYPIGDKQDVDKFVSFVNTNIKNKLVGDRNLLYTPNVIFDKIENPDLYIDEYGKRIQSELDKRTNTKHSMVRH